MSLRPTFAESLEQGGDVLEVMRDRYFAALPAHLAALEGADTFNEYLANFPCLMEYEVLNASRRGH